MRRRVLKLATVLLAGILAADCAAGRAFKSGEDSLNAGNWDAAVSYFRKAVQSDPSRPEYKIALERAMLAASREHLTRARAFEEKGQLDAALGEYRQASEYDATNQQAAAKIQELEQNIRDRIEASRPKPRIEQLQQQIAEQNAKPLLNPASRLPLNMKYVNASVRDILNFIGSSTGINVTYDRDFTDRPYTVTLDGVTLEQALDEIMLANGLFYKVLNPKTIFIANDTPQNRAKFEDQVVRTFYVSHADATDLAQLLNGVIRIPQIAIQPTIVANKTGNTITVRATKPIVDIVQKIIANNDKPAAEVVIDVEILEVNRSRAKQFGLNLSDYSIGGIFSPETNPSTTTSGTGTAGGTATTSSTLNVPPFNLNTVSRGVNTADFYLTVPTAVVRFLESDSQTRLIAKPELRGSEGAKLTLNLGDEIPVPTTSFTPIATGGVSVNPLTSFQYKPVGVNMEITPRVTFDGDIVMDLTVESSTLGQPVSVAGESLPSFGSRKVTTRLRLRDGESDLLAGLLRQDETKSISGFPGAVHLPLLKQLFSSNNNNVSQTDIVMLLTPHIVRTHELTRQDLEPIYIGSQGNFGLTGPAPTIAGLGEQGQAAPAPGAAAAQPGAAQPQPGATPPGTTAPGGATPPANPANQNPANQQVEPKPGPPPGPPTGETVGTAQVAITPPGTQFTVGGGPYTVPISVTSAIRMSTVSLTLTYNPAVLKVRTVQEGSFMRQGGIDVSFVQHVDAAAGRIDITLTRGSDMTGASGSGLLAAVLFDPVAPGTSTITPSGVATGPGGVAMNLQLAPVTVTVK
ncbi:MAG TPA: secretin N-terminal domain-containing protein [Vicinamibacterales bacterium]